jgi:hypothetical protein
MPVTVLLIFLCRPKGRRTGRAPFFDAAGCRIEKSRPRVRWQICLGIKEFSLVTFFATKKVTRAQARKLCSCFLMGIATLNPSYLATLTDTASLRIAQ